MPRPAYGVPNSPPSWAATSSLPPGDPSHADLYAPLRAGPRDDLRRRDLRARTPGPPRRRGRPARRHSGAGQAPPGGCPELDGPPLPHRARSPLVRGAARRARGHRARVEGGALRPPARALPALHRPVGALGAPPLPPRRSHRVAPPPPGSEPAQPAHREAGRRVLRPGRGGQRVRPTPAPERAGRPHGPRLGGALRSGSQVRAALAAGRSPRALRPPRPPRRALSGRTQAAQEPLPAP